MIITQACEKNTTELYEFASANLKNTNKKAISKLQIKSN